MKILLIKMCLFPIIIISGHRHSGNEKIEVIAQNKKIVIIGKALNGKGGALVVVKAGGFPYYLDGMDSWNKKFYGKRVKVSGTLVIYRKKKHAEPPAVEIMEQRIIKKPTWQLVE